MAENLATQVELQPGHSASVVQFLREMEDPDNPGWMISVPTGRIQMDCSCGTLIAGRTDECQEYITKHISRRRADGGSLNEGDHNSRRDPYRGSDHDS